MSSGRGKGIRRGRAPAEPVAKLPHRDEVARKLDSLEASVKGTLDGLEEVDVHDPKALAKLRSALGRLGQSAIEMTDLFRDELESEDGDGPEDEQEIEGSDRDPARDADDVPREERAERKVRLEQEMKERDARLQWESMRVAQEMRERETARRFGVWRDSFLLAIGCVGLLLSVVLVALGFATGHADAFRGAAASALLCLPGVLRRVLSARGSVTARGTAAWQ